MIAPAPVEQPKVTVLSIDDNPGDLVLIVRTLERGLPASYEFLAAKSLCAAQAVSRQSAIDIVVMDLSLGMTTGV